MMETLVGSLANEPTHAFPEISWDARDVLGRLNLETTVNQTSTTSRDSHQFHGELHVRTYPGSCRLGNFSFIILRPRGINHRVARFRSLRIVARIYSHQY